jgi:hypothetical protein
MLKRTGPGRPRSELGYQFLGFHNSPILIEVALFFKSTLRQTGQMENSITPCDLEALGLAARKALAYLQTVGSRR